MPVLLALAGVVLLLATVADAVSTLLVGRGLTARWRPTRVFYTSSWWLWSRVGRALKSPPRRERFLAAFGPLSLLALLVIWLVGLMLGWALIYRADNPALHGVSGFTSDLYYSGTSLLTLGFGDIVARSTALRLLTLVEAVSGLGTIALVISYLPALYGAYSKRETQLLMLDDPTGERIQPTALILLHAPDGDRAHLERFFSEWERWTAEVLESHVSYPMLAYFRSQHPGQSWITALGVVLDAATITAASVEGADRREPYFMYRRALREVSLRLHVSGADGPGVDRALFDLAYQRLGTTGLPLRDQDEAWQRLQEFRSTYAGSLQALIDYLIAPAGFWGHSAEDHSGLG
jgi:voltage-gated potassium channel Kch